MQWGREGWVVLLRLRTCPEQEEGLKYKYDGETKQNVQPCHDEHLFSFMDSRGIVEFPTSLSVDNCRVGRMIQFPSY